MQIPDTKIDGTDTTEYQNNIASVIHDCADVVSEVDEIKDAPLEWAELWSAMRPEPHKWVLTTQNMYEKMLGCVPPRAMGVGGFLVGEATHYNDLGNAVYAMFTNANGFYARYSTLAEFKKWLEVRS